MNLLGVMLVALGGATGSVLRYAVSTLAVEWLGGRFPWGTLAVNVVGSAAIGLAGGAGIGGEWRLLLVTGVLGGFTTFSSFSLETALMIERRAFGQAGIYMTASVILSILALFAGLMLTRRLLA